VTERVLTQRELNRALLARQLLLERASLTPVRALERVAGLQAQDPRAPYIGLWSRVAGFRREHLTSALHRRTAIKATLMRATIHLVSARDYSFFLPAILPMLRGYWRRYATSRGYAYDPDELVARAREHTREPRSGRELKEALGGEGPWWRLRFHEPFVHVPQADEWAFGRQPRYMAAEHWVQRPFATAEDGTEHLVRRYLAGFGPASAQDVAAWSGVPMSMLRPTLAALKLRRFLDERGRVLLDVPRAPLPPADTPAPPRLLAPFDNAVLSHADRTRIVSDEHRQRIIRAGIVDPVFLVDGLVAGRWRLAKKGVVLDPFEPLPRRVQRELREEADALQKWLR
jgi:uncharacterized protein YcaQ